MQDTILDMSRMMLKKSDLISSLVEFVILWGRESQKKKKTRPATAAREFVNDSGSQCCEENNVGRKSRWCWEWSCLRSRSMVSWELSSIRSLFHFSELPGVFLGTPDTAFFRAWNTHPWAAADLLGSRECAFSEFGNHLFLGVPWKHTFCHSILRSRKGIFSCQQLSFLIHCLELSNPRKSPSWFSPVTLMPLPGAEKERGAPAERFVGIGFHLGRWGFPLKVCQTVSIWSCNGRVFNFRLIVREPHGRNLLKNLCFRNSHDFVTSGWRTSPRLSEELNWTQHNSAT